MHELLTPALGAGAGAGGALVLAVTLLVVLFRRRAHHRRSARRDRIITSVQEKWTDVDGIIASYRAKQISAGEFSRTLSDKIETINRTYKPGIHVLDIFFVKYTEKLIDEYSRMAESGVVETLQRETVSMMFPPVAAAPGKILPKDETFPAKTEKEPEASAHETAVPLSQEAVISAVAESSKEEKDLPLETFLAMEAGTGIIEETAQEMEAPGMRQTEDMPPAPDEDKKKEHEESVKEQISPVIKGSSLTEETMTSVPAAPFSLADKVSTVQPPAEKPPSAMHEKEDEETMAEAAVSFPVKIPSIPRKEPPRPVTPLITQPPAAPVEKEETVQESALMNDVEAETIIADRSELLGTGREAEPKTPGDKSHLGITGDDVSDMLDQFFAGKK